MRMHHLCGHRLRPVVPRRQRFGAVGTERAEPVGLVVHDDVPGVTVRYGQAQHRVDAPAEVAAQPLPAQGGGAECVRVPGERIGGGQVQAKKVGHRPQRCVGATRMVAAGQRQLEVQLGQPVSRRDIP